MAHVEGPQLVKPNPEPATTAPPGAASAGETPQFELKEMRKRIPSLLLERIKLASALKYVAVYVFFFCTKRTTGIHSRSQKCSRECSTQAPDLCTQIMQRSKGEPSRTKLEIPFDEIQRVGRTSHRPVYAHGYRPVSRALPIPPFSADGQRARTRRRIGPGELLQRPPLIDVARCAGVAAGRPNNLSIFH